MESNPLHSHLMHPSLTTRLHPPPTHPFCLLLLQGWALRNDNLPLSRAEDAAAAGPTLTVGPRSIDGTDTSIKTSSSRRPPIHRGACGGVAEVECRVYEEPLLGDGTGSCRCFQLTEHAHAAQSHHINELWFALCALPEQLDCSGKQMLPQRGHIETAAKQHI